MIKLATAAIPLLAGAISSCIGVVSDDNVDMKVGEDVTQSVQVEEFTRLAVAGPYEVVVMPGKEISIEAEGPANVIQYTDFSVEDGRLRIRPRKNDGSSIRWDGDASTLIRITSPSLRGASIAGSGFIQIDQVTGDSFDGDVAGSGDLRIQNLKVASADFDIAGSGDIRANGSAERFSIEIAGSGSFENPELNAQEADVSIAGSGDVAANVTRTVAVSIAGSGDVNITGGAKCTVSKVGSGDVNCS